MKKITTGLRKFSAANYRIMITFALLNTIFSIALGSTCPEPSQLQKKHGGDQDMQWVAPGGWRSYSPSFATQIKGLQQVEWQGIHIGQIACVYTPIPSTDFPIILTYNQWVYLPAGKNWHSAKNGLVCHSHQLSDCPFELKPKESVTDINQALDGLQAGRKKHVIF
jgi:hypothetical protein